MQKMVMILTILLTISFTASAAEEQLSIRKVALTFDDGPSPIYTPKILDILKKNDVKATFFVLGKCVKLFPEVLQRIYAEGHLIGNHTYHHKRLTTLTSREVREEILATELEIEIAICKHDPYCDFMPLKFMRPPHGAKNNNVKEAVALLGYKLVMWNVSSDDCTIVAKKLGFHKIIRTIFFQKRRNKEIVLMHDGGGNRTYDIRALPYIIKEYKKRNYEFVTADEFYK